MYDPVDFASRVSPFEAPNAGEALEWYQTAKSFAPLVLSARLNARLALKVEASGGNAEQWPYLRNTPNESSNVLTLRPISRLRARDGLVESQPSRTGAHRGRRRAICARSLLMEGKRRPNGF